MAKSPAAILVDPVDPDRMVGVTADKKLKVTTAAVDIPTGSTQKIIAADNPLSVTNEHDTSWIIPDGKRFYLQQIQAGASGDPTEKGSAIEVFFNNGADHLIARIYITGETVHVPLPEVAKTRDDLDLDGSGTSNSIKVKRRRISGAGQEIDALVIGYYEDTP